MFKRTSGEPSAPNKTHLSRGKVVGAVKFIASLITIFGVLWSIFGPNKNLFVNNMNSNQSPTIINSPSTTVTYTTKTGKLLNLPIQSGSASINLLVKLPSDTQDSGNSESWGPVVALLFMKDRRPIIQFMDTRSHTQEQQNGTQFLATLALSSNGSDNYTIQSLENADEAILIFSIVPGGSEILGGNIDISVNGDIHLVMKVSPQIISNEFNAINNQIIIPPTEIRHAFSQIQ